jgi:Flp pilus assembly protein protease CpaA
MGNISNKVTAATLASAIVAILVWVASAAGVDVPLEVQGAVTTILVFVAGYLVTDPRRS